MRSRLGREWGRVGRVSISDLPNAERCCDRNRGPQVHVARFRPAGGARRYGRAPQVLPPMGAPFILQLCFCWIFTRWLRSRNLASFAESIETGPTRSSSARARRGNRASRMSRTSICGAASRHAASKRRASAVGPASLRAREEDARDLGEKLVVAARILAKKQGGLTGPVAAPHVCAIGGGRGCAR
jgi:hypothetical protein